MVAKAQSEKDLQKPPFFQYNIPPKANAAGKNDDEISGRHKMFVVIPYSN